MAVVLLAATFFYFGRQTKSTDTKAAPPVAESTKTAMAVLPFVNLSKDEDQEYFSDGLTEELLNVLAKNPKLQVTSRTSAFSFKGTKTDIKTVAEKLNVTHVLEGSVRKAGNQIRITAQLIEVSTDSHLWSQTYDRQMENIFAVQDDIAASVAGALKVTLEGGQTPKAQQTNPEAYNAYLQGRHFSDRRSKEDLEKAIGYYERALQIDPNYARAWVGLSAVHSRQADSGYVPVDEGLHKGSEGSRKSAGTGSKSGRSSCTNGMDQDGLRLGLDRCGCSLKRALELEPANADTLRNAAILAAALGRFDEAIRLDRRAIELDPLLTAAHFSSRSSRLLRRAIGRGGASLRKALELNPQRPNAHRFLGRIYLAQSKARRGACRDAEGAGAGLARSRTGACVSCSWERRRKQMRH